MESHTYKSDTILYWAGLISDKLFGHFMRGIKGIYGKHIFISPSILHFRKIPKSKIGEVDL